MNRKIPIDILIILLFSLAVLLVFDTIRAGYALNDIWQFSLMNLLPYGLIFFCARFMYFLWPKIVLPFTVTALEVGGVFEATYAIQQLLGFAVSQHAAFAMTGTFFNPGPLGGFLAMTGAIAFAHVWSTRSYLLHPLSSLKKQPINVLRTWIGLISLLSSLLLMPASFSRSAWGAFAIATVWVLLRDPLIKKYLLSFRKYLSPVLISVVILFSAAFFLKKESALGRLHIWHMEALAIAEQPWGGHGLFAGMAPYGKAQHDYFVRVALKGYRPWRANGYRRGAQ